MLPWQRATESFQFLSFVTTHLDCGSETAQNLNPNWSRSWSWSWTGWTGQTAPHGGAGQAGGEKRITFQSEQKEWTRNRPGNGDTQPGPPQMLTEKVAEAPGLQHPWPRYRGGPEHTPDTCPASTPAPARLPLTFTR